MISNDRPRERGRFLRDAPARDVRALQYLYATFRQGLLEFLGRRPPGVVLMPDYVPEGVYDPFKRRGFEIVFYPMGPDLRLSRDVLDRALAGRRADWIICIHTFGTYVEENVATVRAMASGGALMLEDFAHTLPDPGVPLTGDVAAYSFTKMLGVAEGALLWFARKDLLEASAYSPLDRAGARVRSLMERKFALDSFFADHPAPRVVEGAARRLLRRGMDYYPRLMEHYPSLRARVAERWIEVLNRVDLAGVTERRREIARIYLERLDPRLRLALPDECFLRQALYAFPVRVDDPPAFHAHLGARGIRGFALTDHWWFSEGRGSELLRRHYLLPANHHLSDAKIARVARAANEYAARARG
jgi:dTDP-4-amino-4,6-dideoxygalactose transaminase